jgi:hypothetical protein
MELNLQKNRRNAVHILLVVTQKSSEPARSMLLAICLKRGKNTNFDKNIRLYVYNSHILNL